MYVAPWNSDHGRVPHILFPTLFNQGLQDAYPPTLPRVHSPIHLHTVHREPGSARHGTARHGTCACATRTLCIIHVRFPNMLHPTCSDTHTPPTLEISNMPSTHHIVVACHVPACWPARPLRLPACALPPSLPLPPRCRRGASDAMCPKVPQPASVPGRDPLPRRWAWCVPKTPRSGNKNIHRIND